MNVVEISLPTIGIGGIVFEKATSVPIEPSHHHDDIANWLWSDGGCILWPNGGVIEL